MKKVCVTGAGGFLAMSLIADLLKQGYQVRGTIRDSTQANQIKKDL